MFFPRFKRKFVRFIALFCFHSIPLTCNEWLWNSLQNKWIKTNSFVKEKLQPVVFCLFWRVSTNNFPVYRLCLGNISLQLLPAEIWDLSLNQAYRRNLLVRSFTRHRSTDYVWSYGFIPSLWHLPRTSPYISRKYWYAYPVAPQQSTTEDQLIPGNMNKKNPRSTFLWTVTFWMRSQVVWRLQGFCPYPRPLLCVPGLKLLGANRKPTFM